MEQEPAGKAVSGQGPRVYVRALLRVLLLGLLLFLPRGGFAWPAGLAYFCLYAGWTALNVFLLGRGSPALLRLREGARPGPTEVWDKIFFFAGAPLVGALLLVCSAEGGSSPFGPGVTAGAFALLCGAYALATWALLSNPYAAGAAVLQPGQSPATGGPYAKLRHPFYLAAVAAFLATPAALGSPSGFVPAGLIAAGVIARTALEDRLLRRGLPGYAGYAARVPYRLLPGIW